MASRAEKVLLPPTAKGFAGICASGPTPLQLDQWVELLKPHPDKEFATYITDRIVQGFRIGCNRLSIKLA